MHKTLLSLSFLCLFALGLPLSAGVVSYQITVNTTAASGTYGYVDLELNQGSLGGLPITASVYSLTGGTLNPSDPNNDAIGTTGSLPSSLKIAASTSNDYFEGITFSNDLVLDVTLSGAGVDPSGNATSQSGTVFQLSFFDSASNPLFSSDPSGAAGLINVAPNGTVSTSGLPYGATSATDVTFTSIPEPSGLGLLSFAAVVVLLFLKR